MLSQYMLWP